METMPWDYISCYTTEGLVYVLQLRSAVTPIYQIQLQVTTNDGKFGSVYRIKATTPTDRRSRNEP